MDPAAAPAGSSPPLLVARGLVLEAALRIKLPWRALGFDGCGSTRKGVQTVHQVQVYKVQVLSAMITT
jgi:hypothetical protein